MVITESEMREIWRDGRNPLPAFPPGTRFTPAAQDFLKAHQLEIQFEAAPRSDADTGSKSPAWDKPGAFPVVLSGPVPICDLCGQPVHHKPEHMTQLDAGRYAAKTHPRIRLRGQLDSLHALVMLVAAEARGYQLPALAAGLDTLAAYCREIQSAEYNGRPVEPLALLGKTEAEIHAASHWPEQHIGIAHIVPGGDDHTILHWLNTLRAAARETEIVAVEVYPPQAANSGQGLVQALNRLSSAVYYLEILLKAGRLRWRLP